MTYHEILAILEEIVYEDWQVNLHDDNDHWYLQVVFNACDLGRGRFTKQYGRKWRVSPHMTKSEIVSTAFKAVITAVEHEARENFRYKGKAIYGPHLDVDQLVAFVTDKDNLDFRVGDRVARN
jgi:hypothetical protein